MSAFFIPLAAFCFGQDQTHSVPSKSSSEGVTLQTKLAGKTFESWENELKDEKISWESKRKAVEQIRPEEASLLIRAIEPGGKSGSRVSYIAFVILRIASPELKAKAVPSLLKLLDDPLPNDNRDLAALTLVECGEVGEQAIPRLEELAKLKEKDFKNTALLALTGMRSNQVRRFVLKNDPTVVQFQELYPQSVHFMSYFAAGKTTPKWNSKVGLYGRYELTLQFDLKIDRTKWTTSAGGPPKFYFTEVKSIEMRSGRVHSISNNPDSERDFGLDKWKELVAAKGDLKVLGITPIKDQPIPGFDKTWKIE